LTRVDFLSSGLHDDLCAEYAPRIVIGDCAKSGSAHSSARCVLDTYVVVDVLRAATERETEQIRARTRFCEKDVDVVANQTTAVLDIAGRENCVAAEARIQQ
jgi:hypothetical protein